MAFLQLPADEIAAFLGEWAGEAVGDRPAAAKKSLLEKLPPGTEATWKTLNEPLAELAAADDDRGGPLELRLLDPGATHGSDAFGWTWTGQVGADAVFLIDVLDEGQLARLKVDLGDAGAGGSRVVRYAVTAALAADLAGTDPSGAWSLAAGARAQASIDWFLSDAATTPLGRALLDAAQRFVAPMDLRGQLRLARDDGRFWGTCTRLGGAVHADFSAAAQWQGVGLAWGWGGGKNNQPAPTVGFAVGVSGQASLRLEGSFRLLCVPEHRGGERGLRVRMEHDRRNETELAAQLSAGVDFSALASTADELLRAHLPATEAYDQRLDALIRPGTAVAGRIERLLADLFSDHRLSDLGRLLTGLADPGSAAPALAARVAGPLVDGLDRLGLDLSGASGRLDDLAGGWIRQAFGGLPIADDARAALQAAAGDGIDLALGQVRGLVGELAQSLEGRTVDAAQELLAGFGPLAAMVQGQPGELAQVLDAGRWTAMLTSALSRYGQIRERLLRALGEAQRAKLTLAFGASLHDTRGVHTLFSGWFRETPDMAAAEDLFRALWTGRLADFGRLVAAAQGCGALVEVEGWLERTTQRVLAQSMSISLLGTTVDCKRVIATDLNLKSDLSGNLVAVQGEASVEDEVRNAWVSRQARLGVVARLAGAGTATPKAALEFSGSFSATGAKLDEVQVRCLLRTLSQVAGDSTARIDLRPLMRPEDGFMNEKAFWQSASFMLPMSLTVAEFDRFCRLATTAQIRRVTAAAGARALDACYLEMEGVEMGAALRERAAEVISDPAIDADERLVRYLALLTDERLLRGGAFNLPGDEYLGRIGFAGLSNSGRATATREVRMARVFHRLARGMRRMEQLQLDAQGLQQVLADSLRLGEGEVHERCMVHLKGMAVALEDFAVASETASGIGEKGMPWPLVTFAVAFARLCRDSDDDAGFTPLLSIKGREDRPIPLLAG